MQDLARLPELCPADGREDVASKATIAEAVVLRGPRPQEVPQSVLLPQGWPHMVYVLTCKSALQLRQPSNHAVGLRCSHRLRNCRNSGIRPRPVQAGKVSS